MLACSFGPDSMALFRYLVINKFDFEIVHVNYHILDQADDDEKGIKEEAKKYGIKVHVLSTHMPEGVNEESWARDIRYNYFSEMGYKLGIFDILVAHNKGDLIETYLLQKERGTHLFYGLKEVNKYKEVNIIRPLLNYTKNELLDYCVSNKIPFSIDPSNEDIKFRRNLFRKELLNYSEQELDNFLKEIEENNRVLQGFLEKCDKFIFKNEFKSDKIFLETISIKQFQILLIYFLKANNFFKEISYNHAEDLLIKFRSNKNFAIPIDDYFDLYFEYGIIGIYKKPESYFYHLDELSKSNFIIDKNNPLFNELKLDGTCYIAPAYLGETYTHKNMTMRINREFISWKLPLHLRKVWPAVYNKENKIVYLPRYREKNYKKSNLLSFDIKNLL